MEQSNRDFFAVCDAASKNAFFLSVAFLELLAVVVVVRDAFVQRYITEYTEIKYVHMFVVFQFGDKCMPPHIHTQKIT